MHRIGEVMIRRKVGKTPHVMRRRQIAEFVRLEQNELDIVHLVGEILHVGNDIGRDDIGSSPEPKRESLFHKYDVFSTVIAAAAE